MARAGPVVTRDVLAVGGGSFLARSWSATCFAAERVRFVGREAIGDPSALDGARVVVGFADRPEAEQRLLDDAENVHAAVARWIGDRDCAYVMLSTRRVYAPSDEPLSEDSPLGPASVGGANKLRSEQLVADRLGPRATILRCANLFGYEYEPGRRRFFSRVLEGLALRGEARFDVSLDTRRDFLPDTDFSRVLDRVCAAPRPGVFNVGSGLGLALRRVVGWVIEGFGAGRMVQDTDQARDAFVLDISKLVGVYGSPSTGEDSIREHCVMMGKRLGNEISGR